MSDAPRLPHDPSALLDDPPTWRATLLAIGIALAVRLAPALRAWLEGR